MRVDQFEYYDSRDELNPNSTNNLSSSKKNKKFLIIGLVAVGAVVVLALGLGLGLGLQDDDNTGGNPPSPNQGCDVFPPGRTRRHARDVRVGTRTRKKRWLTDGECPSMGEPTCPEGYSEPPLLVVSMDGFRADYLARGLTPTLSKLSECGVHAPYMRSSFPTKTFPNHYTIMTGLFPESHGIIDNTFYDLEWSEQFVRGASAFDGKWWGGEPMWLTSKRQGKKSATMFWPGSEANITGEYPDYCFVYNQEAPYEERIDIVLDWLALPEEERPSFIALYFDEPDTTGHNEGPFFSEIDAMLERMDGLISSLLDGIRDLGLDQCINLMVVADHGMGEIFGTDKTVYMDDYVDISQYYIYSGVSGRMTSKYVQQGQEIVEIQDPEPVSATLEKLECQHYIDSKDWYVRFYEKTALPKRFHYANNRRIDDIVFDIEDKWKVYRSYSGSGEMGAHGYDNTFKSMRALFMAYGPSFQQNLKVEPFDNIEIYNLMAEVLNVTAAPNNGTSGRLHHLLHQPAPLPSRPPPAKNYTLSAFPEDESEREARRNASDCSCERLEDLTELSEDELDTRLDLNAEEIDNAHVRHAPFGLPALGWTEADVSLLTQTDYTSGYSHNHHMPFWTAFDMHRQEGSSVIHGDRRTDQFVDNCVRPDVRLENATQCSEYQDTAEGIVPAFLYPPGLGNTTEDQLDGHISSNLVPMYESFRAGIWQELLFVLEEYAEKYGHIQVVLGPMFDFDYDGHADSPTKLPFYVNNGPVPLPSHFYAVVTRCDDVTDWGACVNSSEVMGVALLHTPQLSNCWDQTPWRYIQENVIRLIDVEALTSLQLLSDVTEERKRILLATHLCVNLWPRISWADLPEDETLVENAQCPPGYDADHPPVLLISLDGFRPDYLALNLTPTIARLTRQGVAPSYMRSVYPTMTFPNHYTISTGLYPESHGIIDNSMYDQLLEQNFYLGSPNSLNAEWWLGEPIWNTIELQNKTAMTYFWPGSDVDIGGIRPTEYRMYDGDVPYHVRVDTALAWLNGSSGVLPDFISLYFSNVDSAGHEGGPDSLLVDEALEYLDGYIKRLMDGLYRLQLHQCVNIIIVSDHGMSDISCDRVVVANEHLTPGTLEDVYMYYGTSSRISNEYKYDDGYVHVNETERVPYDELQDNLTCVDSNLNIFRKSELPLRLHYVNSERIDELVLVLNETWQADRYGPWCGILGQHGWDANFANLRAFFTAYGPSFKTETLIMPFENIELYHLLAILSDVQPAPNNGTEGSLYHLLKSPPTLQSLPSPIYGDCSYPQDDITYEERANATDCSCDIEDIREADERLNFTETAQDTLERFHAPHGLPVPLSTNGLCLLHHYDFVSAYSSKHRMPLYTAFTLAAGQNTVDVPDCTRADVRLESAALPNCTMYKNTSYHPVFMFPPEWASSTVNVSDSLLTSNTVPMLTSFRTGIWQVLRQLVQEWADRFGQVHGVLGPIFDHEADGLLDEEFSILVGDVPVPSHFFAVILRCEQGDDCASNMTYQSQAFILPHRQNITNCMTSERYLKDNIARIRDIELLTDLQFLTGNTANPDQETLRRTIQQRVFTQDSWW